jgi:hypothetical protein
MARVVLAWGVLVHLSAAAFGDVGKEELQKLARAGLSDELILGYVRHKGPLARLSPDDLLELKKSGLSDSLLVSLLPLQAVEGPKPASTDAATAKLLADPDIVYDGRAFYPRSYFSSDHAAYCSPAIGAAVVNPGWYATSSLRTGGCFRWSTAWGSAYVRTGFGFCGSGGPRYCYR